MTYINRRCLLGASALALLSLSLLSGCGTAKTDAPPVAQTAPAQPGADPSAMTVTNQAPGQAAPSSAPASQTPAQAASGQPYQISGQSSQASGQPYQAPAQPYQAPAPPAPQAPAPQAPAPGQAAQPPVQPSATASREANSPVALNPSVPDEDGKVLEPTAGH